MADNSNQTKDSNNPRKLALTLILCSRNDLYMGNSRWRLQTTLNYIAQIVHELSREEEVEILVADWGSEIPLREVIELSPLAARIVSFLLIPPEIALPLQKDSPFPEVLALNAAARRATGEYIGRIDQDTLVGKRFLNYFFDLYEGRRHLEVPLTSAILFANRRSIPFGFAVRCPPLAFVEKYIHLFGHSLVVWKQNRSADNVFWTSYVGIWLLHRALWWACGGYDERLIYYNWMETDMILRLNQGQGVINLGKAVAFDFYHLEHYNPRENWFARSHAVRNTGIDLSTPPTILNPNGEDWGLIQYPLQLSPGLSIEKKFEANSLVLSRFNWSGFIVLLLSAQMRDIGDGLFTLPRLIWRFLRFWGYRAKIAWETVRGHPVNRWTRLLKQRWYKNRSERMQ
jgi:hypothetical protein